MEYENRGFACCFTGHRGIPRDDEERIRKVLEEEIRKLIGGGYTDFWSGGAVGFDTLAAETVLKLKKEFSEIRLMLALPCKDQHKRWPSDDKCKYDRILRAAYEVVYLCETYCTGCMHLRNKYLVDHSSVCIAYKRSSGGGTEYTVNYAREEGVEVINIAYML